MTPLHLMENFNIFQDVIFFPIGRNVSIFVLLDTFLLFPFFGLLCLNGVSVSNTSIKNRIEITADPFHDESIFIKENFK